MKNFSGIVTWYSADRILGILLFTSNISISLIFILNSKIALVCETEMLIELRKKNKGCRESVGFSFRAALVSAAFDFVYVKFSEINVIIQPSCYFYHQK